VVDDEQVCEFMRLSVPNLTVGEFHAGGVARGALNPGSALFEGVSLAFAVGRAAASVRHGP
jgi:hypothetical protein